MKNYFLLLILILISAQTKFASIKKPTFYISAASTCDDKLKSTVSQQLILFETEAAIQLQKVYPCADITTQYELTSALESIRTKQLLGKYIPGEVENLGNKLSTDYLISLEIKVINNTAIINALCMMNKIPSSQKSKRKILETLSRATLSLPYGNFEMGIYQKIIKELIGGLKKYEICPFTGPVKLHVVSNTKDKQTEEYSVYCNQKDGTYKKVMTIDNSSDAEWNLFKRNKYATDGSIRFTLYEETILEEQNDCYKCSSGREGGRTYYKKMVNSADVQGLSKDSEQYGIKVDDARIDITFTDNDTYTILIKAASKRGDKKEKTEEHAEGTCNNIKPENNSINAKVDVPLFQLLGPFKGNAQDKVLSQKSRIKNVDPNTKEETVIEYEFNLTKD